jgi:predicted ArsR family transcriptional regulator
VTQPWDEALDALSVLVEPVRRSMYGFVRAEGRPVSREEVAEATGASMKLAAFHLDRLVESGWLRARYDQAARPPTGGRPPKLYEPTDRRVELSLPAQRYDLMADILLEASGAGADGVTEQARRAAHDRGLSVAEGFRPPGRHRLGPERTLATAVEVLTDVGFEPRRTEPGQVIMANCPFRALADTAPGTICETSQAFVEGVLAGLGGSGVDADLDRAPGRCCVVLRRTSSRRE